MQLEATPVELHWPVFGDRVQRDCRYRLYSALVQNIPRLKEIPWQMGGFTGHSDSAWLKLGIDSCLSIRCRVQDIQSFSALNNRIVQIGQSLIQLGELTGEEIGPHETLRSDLVIIKLFTGVRYDQLKFAVSLGKQLQQLTISTVPEIGPQSAILIKGEHIIGYPVYFENLQPGESTILQTFGLGGKRRMNCGYFSHR
jgi:CRISPR-associated protein Cas6